LLFATAVSAFTFLLLAVLGGRMAWDEYRYEVTSPGLGIPWFYDMAAASVPGDFRTGRRCL
jgi:hypothetical protein